MRAFRDGLRRLTGERSPFLPEPALENVYRHLFNRDLAALGEPDIFYPTGGAANYSLLYLIMRAANELRPASVLDIGAGQSSLLWNALSHKGKVGKITTLEHDAAWAKMIGDKVDHEVLVTQLRAVQIGAVQTHTYDWEQVRSRGPFEIILCDGPIGVSRFSRYGVMALLGSDLPENFALILDDAERSGEQDTIAAVHDRFKHLGRAYQAGVVRAAKSQMVFATGKYVGLCHV